MAPRDAAVSHKGQVHPEDTEGTVAVLWPHGVRRLIRRSACGAHASRAPLEFLRKRVMGGLILRRRDRDRERPETLVPDGGRFREGSGPFPPGLTLRIARADVAVFLRRQMIGRDDLGRAAAGFN